MGKSGGNKTNKPASRGKKSKTTLTSEDQQLWQHTTQSVTPLHLASNDRVRPSASDTPQSQIKPPAPGSGGASENKSTVEAPAPVRPKPHHPASRIAKTPPLADFDPKAARRIRSGRIAIEARLDLHGMRQHEAHAELLRFLRSAQTGGRRWVLVITGKGTRPFSQNTHQGYDDGLGGYRQPGVLKRLVPQWLGEPELRTVVVSYRTAAAHHGGEGALYIQLRSAKRHPSR